MRLEPVGRMSFGGAELLALLKVGMGKEILGKKILLPSSSLKSTRLSHAFVSPCI
jgi:hypothetical protein